MSNREFDISDPNFGKKFSKALEEEAKKGVNDILKKDISKLGNLRCPEHNKRATLEPIKKGGFIRGVKIDGCCDAFEKTIHAKITS